MEELWVETRDIIEKEHAKTIPVAKSNGKPWWKTHTILKIAEEKWKAKVKGDKKNYYNNPCKEISNSKKGKTRALFFRIQESKGKFKPYLGMLKDQHRNVINWTEQNKEKGNNTLKNYTYEIKRWQLHSRWSCWRRNCNLESEMKTALRTIGRIIELKSWRQIGCHSRATLRLSSKTFSSHSSKTEHANYMKNKTMAHSLEMFNLQYIPVLKTSKTAATIRPSHLFLLQAKWCSKSYIFFYYIQKKP